MVNAVTTLLVEFHANANGVVSLGMHYRERQGDIGCLTIATAAIVVHMLGPTHGCSYHYIDDDGHKRELPISIQMHHLHAMGGRSIPLRAALRPSMRLEIVTKHKRGRTSRREYILCFPSRGSHEDGMSEFVPHMLLKKEWVPPNYLHQTEVQVQRSKDIAEIYDCGNETRDLIEMPPTDEFRHVLVWMGMAPEKIRISTQSSYTLRCFAGGREVTAMSFTGKHLIKSQQKNFEYYNSLMPKASGNIPFGSNMLLTTGNVQCHGARQLDSVPMECSYCHQTLDKVEGAQRRCGRCRLTRYCNKACQAAHYNDHRDVCTHSGLPVLSPGSCYFRVARDTVGGGMVLDALSVATETGLPELDDFDDNCGWYQYLVYDNCGWYDN